MCIPSILCCCDWDADINDHSYNQPLIQTNNNHNVPPHWNEVCETSSHHSIPQSQSNEMSVYPNIQIIEKKDLLPRCEYNSLSKEYVCRYMNSIKKMIDGCKDEPSYFSPYFQLASYKKWSCNYTAHIPKYMMYLWYRAYLYDFETSLQKHDQLCGNNGKITVPYLDIRKYPCIPEELRNFTFDSKYIKGNEELDKVNYVLNDDDKISRMMQNINISYYTTNDNLDELLDKILEAYGFNNVDYPTLHPCFYMILSFVDKLFDSHCKYKMNNITPKNVEYWKILVPFRKLPIELIDTSNLGYKYS